MGNDLIKIVGQVAGIGGIALGVFLLLFRDIIQKSIFPTLKKDDAYRLLRLISLLIWLVAIAGIVAWVLAQRSPTHLSKDKDAEEKTVIVTGDCSPVTTGDSGQVSININCEK
jgi:nitrate reductase gamma subunit